MAAPRRPHAHVWEERPVWDEAAGRPKIVRRCSICHREEVGDG
jgi:hypothetical protein